MRRADTHTVPGASGLTSVAHFPAAKGPSQSSLCERSVLPVFHVGSLAFIFRTSLQILDTRPLLHKCIANIFSQCVAYLLMSGKFLIFIKSILPTFYFMVSSF